MSRTTSGRDIKKQIYTESGIPIEQQELKFAGKEFRDDNLVHECGSMPVGIAASHKHCMFVCLASRIFIQVLQGGVGGWGGGWGCAYLDCHHSFVFVSDVQVQYTTFHLEIRRQGDSRQSDASSHDDNFMYSSSGSYNQAPGYSYQRTPNGPSGTGYSTEDESVPKSWSLDGMLESS